MANPDHVKKLRNGAEAWNAEHIDEPDLTGARLQKLDLQRGYLFGANLNDAHLQHANLSQANIIWSTLRYAKLRNAKLRAVKLIESHATNADFRNADIRDANLQATDFESADFSGANLGGADLLGAKLLHADLRRANLERADLRFCRDLQQEQIEHALGDLETKLPADIRRPPHWFKPDAEKTGKGAEAQPPSEFSKLPNVPSPVLLAWSGDNITVASPPNSPSASTAPAVRERLIEAQTDAASMLAETIATTNADQRLVRYLLRYAEGTVLGSYQLNILHLDTLYRSLHTYFVQNIGAVADIDEAVLLAFFQNHQALRETYPEWHEFEALLRRGNTRVIPNTFATKLQSVVSEPPADQLLDTEARRQIHEEIDQPETPLDQTSTSAKTAGIVGITILLWRLLSQAPQAMKNWDAVEALAKKLKPLIDIIRATWPDSLG